MIDKYIEGEIDFNIENIINDIGVETEKKKKIESLTRADIEEIRDNLLNNYWFITELNELVNGAIENEICHYIDKE